jgi:hypothetical protein
MQPDMSDAAVWWLKFYDTTNRCEYFIRGRKEIDQSELVQIFHAEIRNEPAAGDSTDPEINQG